MVTTLKSEPIIEHALSNPDEYSSEYGFYQIGFDLIKEEAEIIDMMIQNEFAGLSCVDEASLVALQEEEKKGLFARLAEIVKNFIEKFSLAFQRTMARLSASFKTVGSALKIAKQATNDKKWEDNPDKTVDIDWFISRGIAQCKEVKNSIGRYTVIIGGISGIINSQTIEIPGSLEEMLKPENIKKIPFAGEDFDGSISDFFKKHLVESTKISKTKHDLGNMLTSIGETLPFMVVLDGSRKSIIKELQTLQKNLKKMALVEIDPSNINTDHVNKNRKILSTAITTTISEVNRYFTQLIVFYSSTIKTAASKAVSLVGKEKSEKAETKGKAEKVKTEEIPPDRSDWQHESVRFWFEESEGTTGSNDDGNKETENQSNGAGDPPDDENVEEEAIMSNQEYGSLMEQLYWESDGDFGDNHEFIENPPSEAPEAEVQIDPENDQYGDDPSDDDGADDYMDDDNDETLTIESQFII